MPRFLRSLLKGLLTEQESLLVQSSFDIVGDIAIVKLPDELLPKEHEIGRALLKNLNQVRTVLRQVSGFSGELRIRELEFLAGEQKFETIYMEHGCVFRVNLAAAYFSPRLAYERKRVATLVKPGETVVNLFGGVGTFSIVIAKTEPTSLVYSIDLNPTAHQLAAENALRNRVADRVIAVYGDSREIVRLHLAGRADRVLMPLPEVSKDFLGAAVSALKPSGGIIHYYTVIRAARGEDAVALAREDLSHAIPVPYEVTTTRVVTEVAPRVTEVVSDIRVLPL